MSYLLKKDLTIILYKKSNSLNIIINDKKKEKLVSINKDKKNSKI